MDFPSHYHSLRPSHSVMGDDNPMNKMCSDVEYFTSDDDSGISESDDDDDDSSDSSESSSDVSEESTRKDFEFHT